MASIRHRATLLTLAGLSLSLALAACQAKVIPNTKKVEGKISQDLFSNVTVSAEGRTFKLQDAEGKPIGPLAVQTQGRVLNVTDGRLALAAADLNRAKSEQRGFFTVMASGFIPRQVWMGQAEDVVTLYKANPLMLLTMVPPFNPVVLKDPQRTTTVTLPAGMLSAPTSTVALSSYVPEVTKETQAGYQLSRAAMEAKLKAAGKPLQAPQNAPYRVAQVAPPCDEAVDVLPCTLSQSLGLLITVNDPLTPGRLNVSYDLGSMLNGWDGVSPEPWTPVDETRVITGGAPAPYGVLHAGGGNAYAYGLARQAGQPVPWHKHNIPLARAAARMADYYHRLEEVGAKDIVLGPDVTLVDGVLSFSVEPGNIQTADPVTQVARGVAEQLAFLGVHVEVTLVYSRVGALSPMAVPPDLLFLDPRSLATIGGALLSDNGANLVTNNGGNILANNGGTIISSNAGNILSNNGSTLISNNSGGLSGSVSVPFAPVLAKFKTLSELLQEYPWPRVAKVRLVDGLGSALTDWQPTDINSRYNFTDVPGSSATVFVEVQADNMVLSTIAPAPADVRVQSDVNSGTTGVTALLRERIDDGALNPVDINLVNFHEAVEQLRGVLTLKQAENLLRKPAAEVAQSTTTLMADNEINVDLTQKPVLLSTFMNIVEMPHFPTPGARTALGFMTGLPSDDMKPSYSTALPGGTKVMLDGNRLSVAMRGYGKGVGTDGYDGFLFPEPLRIDYTVRVRRGERLVTQYDFMLSATNAQLLDLNGAPIPLNIDMSTPPQPGTLLGNFWTYLGEGNSIYIPPQPAQGESPVPSPVPSGSQVP